MIWRTVLTLTAVLGFPVAASAEKIPCDHSGLQILIEAPIKSEGCFLHKNGKSASYSWDEESRFLLTRSDEFYKAWESVAHIGVVLTYTRLSDIKESARRSNAWIRDHGDRWNEPQEKFGGQIIQVQGQGDGHRGTCFVFRWFGGKLGINGAEIRRFIQHCRDISGRWFNDDEVSETLKHFRFARDPKSL